MSKTESQEKAELLKDALKIVDELGKFDDDLEYWELDDHEEIEKLITRSKKLKRSRFWRLT